MANFLRFCLIALLFWFINSSTARADSLILNLLGRSNVDGYRVQLDDEDVSWLRARGRLILGASLPDHTPFDLSTSGQDYEGLTADYAQLIGQLLKIDIQVRRYSSRREAVDALKAGEVDLLGSANGYEATDPELVMSDAYAQDQPTLVTRIDNTRVLEPDLSGKIVAMLFHYLPYETVKAFYPDSTVVLYPSIFTAIGAVAFGQADVYLGDAISANYLINKNYLNNVQLSDFSRLEVQPFSFALTRDSPRLLSIINQALAVIPRNESAMILRRWSAGQSNVQGKQQLLFSAKEQAWLDQHPRIRVAINERFLPLTFIDNAGEFRGISADLLTKIGLRSGLKFDIQRGNSVNEMIDQVMSGKADMLAAFSAISERERELQFTRPYLFSPFVLVTTTAPSAPSTLDGMAGKRLALFRGNGLRDYLIEHYPQVQVVTTENAYEAMTMVAQGKVDGTITSLVSASYMISREFRERLRVSSTVGTLSAHVAFATRKGSQLQSILDKVLLSIAPEEIDELTNRWRNEVLVEDSYWLRNRAAIFQGFGIAAILLLFASGWIAYLRSLIRKRLHAERALSEQLQFMQVLIDGTPNPIYVRDCAGRMLICNVGYLKAFGVDRESVMGKTLLESALRDPNEASRYHQEYLDVMADGKPVIQDRQLKLDDDRVLTIYHWMMPYRGRDGEVQGMIAGWIDISDRQRLLEQLHEAKNEADDANRAKTTFLATMSHEIRTPMNAVIGMLELALKKAEQGVVDRLALEVASFAAHGMLELIGDILDIARIESGRLSLVPERTNLHELLHSLVRVFEGLARQKRLSMKAQINIEPDVEVMVDPLRFKQIVSNLLSNAIKFTAQGSVRISVTVCPGDTQGRLRVCLQVIDSGIGISVADQQRLFSPFSQAANNPHSARIGSGLGLMICRTLCEMMGGQLQLSSILGLGTQVEVTLSLERLEPLPDPFIVDETLQKPPHVLSVLVVDDYSPNRLLLTQQLQYLGHRVTDAEEGAQALNIWRSGYFDVVITDCNMPLMNGYELAHALREEEGTRACTPVTILGFTANAQPEEKVRCLEAGMDDCLFKPISLKDLNQRLIIITEGLSLNRQIALADDRVEKGQFGNLQKLTGGDKAVTRELVGDLLRSNECDMNRLLKLYVRRDLRGLADLAHRVKGGALIIDSMELIKCCEAVEVASATADANALIEAVDQLLRSMEALAAYLAKLAD